MDDIREANIRDNIVEKAEVESKGDRSGGGGGAKLEHLVNSLLPSSTKALVAAEVSGGGGDASQCLGLDLGDVPSLIVLGEEESFFSEMNICI